jgi:uncharacterized protein (TIGR03118 family)
MKLQQFALGLSLVAGLCVSIGAESLAAPRFKIVPLVSDQPGVAPNTDPDLINPWGLSHPPGGPNWVSDNGTNKSTVYDRETGAKQSLVVSIQGDEPTGNVFVPSGTGFVIKANGSKAPALFLFDTVSGTIEGWNPSLDPTQTIIAVDNSQIESGYTGLALDPAGKLLFAADFANNQVQVFDNRFKLVRSFSDPGLPSRFAPFNVAWINNRLYVAFAKHEDGEAEEIPGKGLGYVDVFDAQGNLLKRLISRGKLNAPWGMTIAPAGFATFSESIDGALLVGNFGDGKINAYDPVTGDFLATLRATDGTALTIDGLWALEAGPGDLNVTFTAGPEDETHGLLGLITPARKAVAAE